MTRRPPPDNPPSNRPGQTPVIEASIVEPGSPEDRAIRHALAELEHRGGSVTTKLPSVTGSTVEVSVSRYEVVDEGSDTGVTTTKVVEVVQRHAETTGRSATMKSNTRDEATRYSSPPGTTSSYPPRSNSSHPPSSRPSARAGEWPAVAPSEPNQARGVDGSGSSDRSRSSPPPGRRATWRSSGSAAPGPGERAPSTAPGPHTPVRSASTTVSAAHPRTGTLRGMALRGGRTLTGMAIPPALRDDSSASDAERVPTIPPPVEVGGGDGVVNAVDPESPGGAEPARRAWRSDSVDAGPAEQRGAEPAPVKAAQPLVATRTAIVPVRPSISPVTAAPNVRIAVWHEDLPVEHTLPFVSAPESEIAASFRLLRHRLMKQPGSDVMAVTSAKRGEGKTLCAANLAMAVAEHLDGPVLLVEANLQFPSLARFLNFQPPLCFGEQLRYAFRDPDYEWQVVALASTNLHVLAVDPEVTESQLLSAPAFSRAMKQLASSHYECVIVDCPPVTGSADVNIVADLVGGLLFAARAGVSKKAELRQAAASVEPATILGTVLLPTLKPQR